MSDVSAFIAARDFLLAHCNDYDAAYSGFKWPKMERFNWALDYFDALAKGNDAPALWIVEEDGSASKRSFAEMSSYSNRVANWLSSQGVKRGDRIMIMLGNEVPLWDTMLAAIKLGAVVIPATTLLAPDDLIDRVERGEVKHVVAGKAPAGSAWRTPTTNRTRSRRAAKRAWMTPCCCISPRARRRNRSWCCTRISLTRSGICRPCTGSASNPATVT